MSIRKRSLQAGCVHTPQPHDSALKHTTGEALYVDDMPEPPGTLHAAFVLSPVAHGLIRGIDSSAAATAPGVHAIICAKDIPGANDIGPVMRGEVLFADPCVEYAGQLVAAVVADTLDQARAAAELVRLDLEEKPAVLSIEQALEQKSLLFPPMVIQRGGDVVAEVRRAEHRLSGHFKAGGQEHFYLEGQVALAVPSEDKDIVIYSSSQNPTDVQVVCARLLGVELNRITVIVRRMGGGFGGKETNASWVAGAAAILATITSRPVKIRLPRIVDMVATGKRHGFNYSYDVGFDSTGAITVIDAVLSANGGHSVEMTPGVLTRALITADNCYYLPCVRLTGYGCKTNTVSNTAFRGYGSPQGAVMMEHVIERIAFALGLPIEVVQERNFYGETTGRVTPYGQPVTNDLICEAVSRVRADSDIESRRAEIQDFNNRNAFKKRGLGLFPLKYGVSFTTKHLNQAGALVHVYKDGSIRLGHGGTEMGQGLFVKVAQVVAEVFRVDLDRVRISATSTAEVPNTSPTAGSTGSDLNGAAAYRAAMAIKMRMLEFAARHFGVSEEDVRFEDNHVHVDSKDGGRALEFGEFARMCWTGSVPLSSTGFYQVPDIHWDAKAMRGSPNHYFVYAAAVSEVEIDSLTGETRVLRADIVEDCGRSLNQAIDIGQIEGAYVQGLGWMTCEELWWDGAGRLKTHGPSTYKIPGSRDVPEQFNVRILDDRPAKEDTIFHSKGVGEPPLVLATSVWIAIKDAIRSAAGKEVPIDLDIPATPERILRAIEHTRGLDPRIEAAPAPEVELTR
jgi:xanthine dehydrogenase large subunit